MPNTSLAIVDSSLSYSTGTQSSQPPVTSNRSDGAQDYPIDPKRSRSCPNRDAKKVSGKGMNTSVVGQGGRYPFCLAVAAGIQGEIRAWHRFRIRDVRT